MIVGNSASYDIFDVCEAAVGNREVYAGTILHDSGSRCRAKGFSVQAERNIFAEAPVCIVDHRKKIFCLQDTVGAWRRSVFAMSAKIINDTVISPVKIDLHVFECSEAIVGIPVCEYNILAGWLRVFEKLSVNHVAFVSADCVCKCVKIIHKVDIIPAALPLQCFFQCLTVSSC